MQQAGCQKNAIQLWWLESNFYHMNKKNFHLFISRLIFSLADRSSV
jgi:hypothetical protein